ncbi:hypothetical protein [Roseibium polysiphoniae]|uniref:Uncharacterized protein n=1 Tax=Roseibium polysiphoniae TaxID=2571221 RepID=A0ABR9C951_9HYPH|nr:hypothetical protein [Roseibium polysiphoniae]MBD8875421.1 hypothetical protein [Roseibium polysiphoniae]
MSENSHEAVMRLFCTPIAPLFKRVPGGNRRAFIRAVCRSLQEFDDPVLSEAAHRILRTAKGMTWPNAGELYQTCATVRDELRRKAEQAATMADRQEGAAGQLPLPETVAVDIMIAKDPDLVRYAVEGDYHTLLLDHVRQHRGLPDDDTCERLLNASRDRLVKAQAQAAAHPGPIENFYLQGLLNRRRAVARMIESAFAEREQKRGAAHGEA